jgi:hypothetical protein
LKKKETGVWADEQLVEGTMAGMKKRQEKAQEMRKEIQQKAKLTREELGGQLLKGIRAEQLGHDHGGRAHDQEQDLPSVLCGCGAGLGDGPDQDRGCCGEVPTKMVAPA